MGQVLKYELNTFQIQDLIYKMYKGTEGKIGGLVTFVEEAGFFGTDFLPTFTLTWIYRYLLKKETFKEEDDE